MANSSIHKTATLSCADGYTSFDMGSRVIWSHLPQSQALHGCQADNSYIVVDAEYEGLPSTVEEYIDLVPILENLYLDPATVLSPIKKVHVA